MNRSGTQIKLPWSGCVSSCTSEQNFPIIRTENFLSAIKGFVTQDRAKIWRDKYICVEDRLPDVLFSDRFPKKRSDHESQKSGFRFDLKNPLEVWILWIHDPFLDFSNKTQNLFSRCLRSGSGAFFNKKMFIRNISGYKGVLEMKFGTRIDFTVLNIFKWQWNLYAHVTCHVTLFLKISHIWRIANGFSRKHQRKQLFRCKTIISNLSRLEWTSSM